ncbi:MAG: hypothetical protein QOI99_67 [Actinomycetota bacterium]|jgi:hypothetical protein|nr:hypothetical protein [Actinomycetota bacterium]
MMTRAVRRSRKGFYEIRLPESERVLLRSLAPQMRELLSSDDPVLDRLFPVAYPMDEDRETEYRLLVRDELRSSHEAALAALEESADAERLDEEQLQAWMRAVNEVRLVLGTRLDVTEEGDERPTEPDDPREAAFAVYDYLTWLQGTIVEALSQ